MDDLFRGRGKDAVQQTGPFHQTQYILLGMIYGVVQGDGQLREISVGGEKQRHISGKL